MIKYIFPLCLFPFLFQEQNVYANNAGAVNIKYFEVDDVAIYDVTGCIPKSGVALYSLQDGGDLLNEASVDINGNTRIIWNKKRLPAFVLNVQGQNAKNIDGNGTVAYVADKEFSLKDMAINTTHVNTSITWNAAVTHPGDYFFQVSRSVNGAAYEVIDSISAESETTTAYNMSTHIVPDAEVSYEITIASRQHVLSYTSPPLYDNRNSPVVVYPTVAANTVYVQLNNGAANGRYSIVNIKGQVVQSGMLKNTLTEIAVKNLPPGDYLVKTLINETVVTKKFIKQ